MQPSVSDPCTCANAIIEGASFGGVHCVALHMAKAHGLISMSNRCRSEGVCYLGLSLLNKWYNEKICLSNHGIFLQQATNIFRGHSGLSQWETTLQCNVVSHWLSPYPEWAIILLINWGISPWHPFLGLLYWQGPFCVCDCAPSQWETTLHCNVVSHWLGAYKK